MDFRVELAQSQRHRRIRRESRGIEVPHPKPLESRGRQGHRGGAIGIAVSGGGELCASSTGKTLHRKRETRGAALQKSQMDRLTERAEERRVGKKFGAR